MRKFMIAFCVLCSFLFTGITYSADFSFREFTRDDSASIPYCNDPGECGLQEGIDTVQDALSGSDIETDRTLSQYIQDVVVYLLSFISIIAVLFIIYSGFEILTSGGDEERVKKARQRIIYVAIGMIIIWLAYSIVSLFLTILI